MSETQEQQGSLGTSLLIFLLGVAVGATVAILYAPAAGTETRAQIAEKAGHLKERASEMTHQVAEKAGELKERVAARLRPTEETSAGAVEAAGVADSAKKDGSPG